MPPPEQITDLLLQLRSGDSDATERLYSAVYEELRQIAHRHLQHEPSGHTLQTTGLVHETYIRLVDLSRIDWQDRGHFFRIASGAMRRILVDYARRHRSLRRGGGIPPAFLDDDVAAPERGELLLALDEALDRLSAVSVRLSQVVECRFFGGLTEEETAEALGVTTRTVQRDWAKARGWLYLELREGEG
jgi:RNA polymerase sigma factor (TIGR02999 family)